MRADVPNQFQDKIRTVSARLQRAKGRIGEDTFDLSEGGTLTPGSLTTLRMPDGRVLRFAASGDKVYFALAQGTGEIPWTQFYGFPFFINGPRYSNLIVQAGIYASQPCVYLCYKSSPYMSFNQSYGLLALPVVQSQDTNLLSAPSPTFLRSWACDPWPSKFDIKMAAAGDNVYLLFRKYNDAGEVTETTLRKTVSSLHDEDILFPGSFEPWASSPAVSSTKRKAWSPYSTEIKPIHAASAGDFDYVFINSEYNERPTFTRRRKSDGAWSPLFPIVPVDYFDEDSLLTVIAAGPIPSMNRVGVTLVQKRKFGQTRTIFLLGPDDSQALNAPSFVVGRYAQLNARSDILPGFFTPVDCPEGTIWDSSPHILFPAFGCCSKRTYQRAYTDLDATQITAQFGANQPPLLNAAVGSAEIDLEDSLRLVLGSNGAEYPLGDFSVSSVTEESALGDYGETGKEHSLRAVGSCFKELQDYQPDCFRDFLSQEVIHANPKELTKVISHRGGWSDDGTYLVADELNETSIAYTNASAADGCFMAATFDLVTSGVIYGVGVNFRQESLAEAASRLGTEIAKVSADQRATTGLFALLIPYLGHPSGGYTLYICLYNNQRITVSGNEKIKLNMKPIATAPFPDYDPGPVTLAMSYRDGHYTVYGKSGTVWNFVTQGRVNLYESSSQYGHIVRPPNYGRGAVYLRNDTGYGMAYPFENNSDVVPLYPNTGGGTADADTRDEVFDTVFENWNSNLASSGTVVVDEEEISYIGKKALTDAFITGQKQLVYCPGKIGSASGFTPLGSEIAFANSRQTNYVVQPLNGVTNQYPVALDLWLKKVNYPEDGVEVSIYGGPWAANGNTQYPLGTPWVTARIGAEKIPAEGGMVRVMFDNTRVLNADCRIVVRRANNPNNPNAANYYAFKTRSGYAGGNAYLFREDNDTIVVQSGALPFTLYTRVADPGGQKAVCVTDPSGTMLTTYAANYFDGAALVSIDGAGMGRAWRITGYQYIASGAIHVFNIDRNPGNIFDTNTRFLVTNALYGLTRGANDSSAMFHGSQVKVSMKAANLGRCSWIDYYGSDEDYTVAEAIREIATVAGIREVDLRTIDGIQTITDTSTYTTAQTLDNFIIGLETIGIATSLTLEFGKYRIVLGSGSITLKENIESVWTTLQSFPYTTVNRAIKVSKQIYEDGKSNLSIWSDGRLLCGFYIDAESAVLSIENQTGAVLQVRLYQAFGRVDNFSFDVGQPGLSTIAQLIGNKRVYLSENNGVLSVYTERAIAPAISAPISISTTRTDAGAATRLLVQGGEEKEVTDAKNHPLIGDVFRVVNVDEINNLNDAAYYANLLLEDARYSLTEQSITAQLDPTFEPTDEAAGLIIDRVTYNITMDETSAICEMAVDGRPKQTSVEVHG